MEHSESLKTFAPAFVAAQAKIKGATKDAVNKFFDNRKYADLSSVMDACKSALNDEGIAVLQTPEPCDAGKMALNTVLMHKSGEWISGTMTIPLAKSDPQGYGSAMTYARRYSLAAMVGVCPEDDDGEAAVGRGTNGNQQPLAARQQRPAPRAPVQRQPEQVNTDTGEVTTEKTVPADPASFGEYGDLMDDAIFEEAIINEMKKRSFPDQACVNAQASACRVEGVTGLGGITMPRRGQFITAIRAGFFDRFRDELKQQPKATNRPARVAAARK